MKFIKIVWILSVFVILTFNITFEGFRILDFISGNYIIEIMKVSNYSYGTYSQRKSVTINGNIRNEEVYFYRFDEDIEKLSSLYENIHDNKSNNFMNIEVLKFENSRKVLLIKDNEFQRWKKHIYLSALYCIVSTVILIFIKVRK